MEVKVQVCDMESLRDVIQAEKDAGKRILAIASAKVIRGKVTEFVVVSQ